MFFLLYQLTWYNIWNYLFTKITRTLKYCKNSYAGAEKKSDVNLWEKGLMNISLLLSIISYQHDPEELRESAVQVSIPAAHLKCSWLHEKWEICPKSVHIISIHILSLNFESNYSYYSFPPNCIFVCQFTKVCQFPGLTVYILSSTTLLNICTALALSYWVNTILTNKYGCDVAWLFVRMRWL